MRRLALALLALAPLLVSAQPVGEELPLLRPVRLTAGVPDTLLLADLLGAVDGVVSFPGQRLLLTDGDALALVLEQDEEGLALLPFTVDDEPYALPVEVRVPTTHTFTFTPDLSLPDSLLRQVPDALFVIGGFNDWARGRDRLTDADGDGLYAVTLPVEPGRYEYKFQLGAAEVMDPARPDSVANPFGAYNNVVTVRPRRSDRAVLRPTGWSHSRTPTTQFTFALDWREADANPLHPGGARVVALLDNRPLRDDAVSVQDALVTVDVPDAPGAHTLRLAADLDGLVTPWIEVPLWNGAPRAASPDAPFVWQDAVVYQIMIDRFHDGDPSNSVPVEHDSLAFQANYQGGDLQGILDKLEEGYFDDLGVNALWLSPVYDNPEEAHREYPPPHRFYTGYHGYWPTKPRAVEERFGDLEGLWRLVDAAHARGIKVLLDFVAHHVHEDHPYVREHPEWFGELELPDGRLNLRLWDEHRLTTWFEPYLPTFDFTDAPEAVDAMTADAVWWLEQTGADGFRHDAVKHVPNEFWRALTARLQREVAPEREARNEPPLYQIGETFGSYDLIASYVNASQLDAQFNFNLYDAALATFLSPDASFEGLAREMERTLDVYGPRHVMGNLMDSHDKPRFLALADGDLSPGADAAEIGWTNPPVVDDPKSYRRAELYLAYLLTIPGVPTIYYGDEIGMTGAADPDNRRMMRFEGLTAEEAAMKEATARLVRLRREHAALRHGAFETLYADQTLWAYLRATPEDAILVALNKGTGTQARRLELPAAYAFQSAADPLTGERVEVNGGTVYLEIPAGGYRILRLSR